MIAMVATAARACVAGELGTVAAAPTFEYGLRVAAVGTTAAQALNSALLMEALTSQRLCATSAQPYSTLSDCVSDASCWDLGLVLSPFKSDASSICTDLSPSARDTAIVDTVLVRRGRLLGVNTNSWALAEALAVVLHERSPEHVLLLGAGATARSAVLGLTRRWPACRITVSARRDDTARELAERFGASYVSPEDTADVGATIVINATTWGETEKSEMILFRYPIDRLLRPGTTLLDLNNRLSALQTRALTAGCVVLSGTLMQRMTHACRAGVARWCFEEATDDRG